MQYRQHRSDADAGARQDERVLARFEREAASWRAYLQPVADADLMVEISAGRTANPAFNGYAVLGRSALRIPALSGV